MDATELGVLVAAVGALAAAGAWAAAVHANRFQRSWLVEPQDEQFVVFLVRNNTRRPADLLQTEALPRVPGDTPYFDLDTPQIARVMPDETFGVRVVNARSIKIEWSRRPWWKFGARKAYSGEWSLPLKYNRPARKPSRWERLLRL